MISNSDLQKWQTAVNGINESGQKELTGEEWSALMTLNNSLQNSNFESDESRHAFNLLKNNLSRYSDNQILQIHLQNFIILCEQYFTNKSESSEPQVPPPTLSPKVNPQSQSATPSPTFGNIPSEDTANWQKAIQGVEAKQNNLSPEEWSAFAILKTNYINGNWGSGENDSNIQILKKALPHLSTHRLLQIHLKNFITLCNQYFKTNGQTISRAANPTTRLAGTANSNTRKIKRGNNKTLIFIIAALVVGFFTYTHWDSVKGKLGIKTAEIETIRVDDKIDATTDLGVVINGVKWATRNIDKPGTFASTPESAGMFYQWNRKIGWSASDSLVNSNGGTEWDNSAADGLEWLSENDPSPSGWQVPTFDEIRTLFDITKVASEWTKLNGVYGRQFTDKATGKFMFLPAVGQRSGNNGSMFMSGGGFYWSATAYRWRDDKMAFILFFTLVRMDADALSHYSNGNLVRSVANTENVKVKDIEWNSQIQQTEQRSTNSQVNSNSYSDDNNVSLALSTRLLTEDDLNGISKRKLRILRNEIYARHGYFFKSKDLRDYYSAKDWYHPQYNDVSNLLNTIEKRNVAFIQRHE